MSLNAGGRPSDIVPFNTCNIVETNNANGVTWQQAHLLRNRNWRPEGGEWEPIKIYHNLKPGLRSQVCTQPSLLECASVAIAELDIKQKL